MSNLKIPMSMVGKRKSCLESKIVYDFTSDPTRCQMIAAADHKNEFSIRMLQKFFKESSCKQYANNDSIKSTSIKLLKTIQDNPIFNESEVNGFMNSFVYDVMPYMEEFDTVIKKCNECDMDSIYMNGIEETAKNLLACDRVLRNHNILTERFNISQIANSAKYSGVSEAAASLCELIDTYYLPIQKKINTALENIGYAFYKEGFTNYSKEELVEAVTDYFLANTDEITDYSYNKILNVLENNPFVNKESTARVNYLFEHTLMLEKATQGKKTGNKDVDELLVMIGTVENEKEARTVIYKAFLLIYRLFFMTSIITIEVVDVILAAIFALVLSTFAIPIKGIGFIEDAFDKYILKNKNKDKEFAVVYIKKAIDDLKEAPVKETSDILMKETICDAKSLKPTPNYSSMKSVLEFFNTITESEDFANSDDIQDIIKSYKAEQNKGFGKFKRTIERIYIRNPESIIDETGHVLEFIRNFGIIGTLAIHPVITVVLFITDKIIEMDLKRKEAEKVNKYFHGEREKVERLIEKSSGEKKERYEEYAKCLDRCLEKLDEYRESLYSDAELDKMNQIEEASSVALFNKIPLCEYFESIHKDIVCKNIATALQMLSTEIKKNSNPSGILEFSIAVPYYYKEGENIINTLQNIDQDTFAQQFISPDGLVQIPLYKISYKGEASLLKISEIVSFVNGYLDRKCILNEFNLNNSIYISLIYLEAILSNANPDFQYTEEIREAFSDIKLMEDLTESINELPQLDTELARNIEALVKDDIEAVATAVRESYANTNLFKNALLDYKDATSDIDENFIKIGKGLNILAEESPFQNLNEFERMIVKTDSTAFLIDVMHEIKVIDKAGEAVAAVKKNIDKTKKNIADGKKKITKKVDSINTKSRAKLGLSAETIKHGIQDMSTKEKEISKTIDAYSSNMKRNVEKALTTDKRESIIKGSIVPSFSKILKSGIAIAVSANVLGPVITAIGTIGALACSKKLTDKERQMLLDEIDIELKTVEKEINRAESEGKMKEYKALLTYQRKLQREQQRIKYRLKLFNKEVPDVKGEDD